MLYDPKWEQKTETKADPFKIGTLIAWLEKQPAAERYDYYCNGGCLLARYFAAKGFRRVHMFSDCFAHGQKLPGWMGQDEVKAHGLATPLPPKFNDIALALPRTFGAALERARAFASA